MALIWDYFLCNQAAVITQIKLFFVIHAIKIIAPIFMQIMKHLTSNI